MERNRRFPNFRARRIREHSFSRDLTKETELSCHDLIYPVFITDDDSRKDPVLSMPGVFRLGRRELFEVCEQCLYLGVRALALFPVVLPELKSLDAKEAYKPDGLVPKTVRELKSRFPNLGIITDIALDPYTSHGQDGILSADGSILNEETVAILQKQALCHAQAGVDIVAPSDMMDGRVGRIREALDEQGFLQTMILSYAAKYASAFYGPFREALGSQGNLGSASKETYQMDPANGEEALHEVAMDLAEGADMVMIKPGLPYLDVVRRVRDHFGVATFVYMVSGEYAMFKAAGAQGLIDEKKTVLEALLSCKRAGAHAILTYHALEAARWLSPSS